MSYEEALSELSLALEDAGADDVAAATVHLQLADMTMTIWRVAESREHLEAAIALGERAGAEDVVTAALSETGFLDSMCGLGVTAAAARAYERWDGTFTSPNAYSPRLSLACARMHAGEFAERRGAPARTRSRRPTSAGIEIVEVLARNHLAEVQTRAGDWAAALANARLSERARTSGGERADQRGRRVSAGVRAGAPRRPRRRTRGRARRAGAHARRCDDVWYETALPRRARSRRADRGRRRRRDRDARAGVGEDAGGRHRQSVDLPRAARARRGVCRRRPARRRRSRSRRPCAACRPPRIRGAARWRAAARRSSRRRAATTTAARAALDDALAAHAELPEPFERARTLHVQGRVERRARNWATARTSLTEALTEFDALGAARWAEKAGADLARLPGRRPAAGRRADARPSAASPRSSRRGSRTRRSPRGSSSASARSRRTSRGSTRSSASARAPSSPARFEPD